MIPLPHSPAIDTAFQSASVDVDLPVRFEARQKMLTRGANQIQVLNRFIPAIETNQIWTKTALPCGKQHFGKMVVPGFAIAVFIKDAVITGNTSLAVSPKQRNQINAGDDRFLLARPMPVNKDVEFGKRFLKGRIIKNKDAALQINLRLNFLPQCFGIRFESLKKLSKSVVGGPLGSPAGHARLQWRSPRVAMIKLM